MTRRAQYRADTRQEVKDLAMAQLAAAGPAGISLNAIAKRMGVTGPALYRYFGSRDALLTELIADAYGLLADTVEAVERGPDPGTRLRAMAHAFREWAVASPHRYLLLFGTPVPGYTAPEETLEAAQRTLMAFARVYADLPAEGRPLDDEFAGWVAHRGASVPPSALRRAVVGWARLHGVLSLECEGHFAIMGFDSALLYRDEVEALLNA